MACIEVQVKIDFVHLFVADPDVRVALIDEEARFMDQAKKQTTLHIDEHNREHHAHYRGDKLAAIGHQGFEREGPHMKTYVGGAT